MSSLEDTPRDVTATAASPSRAGWHRILRPLGLAVVVAVLVALIILNVALHASVESAQQKVDAGSSASKAAQTEVAQLLSYDYRTIDQDANQAVNSTTGAFRTELRALEDKVVRPTALAKQVVTKTQVVGVSVVQESAQTVELLIFVNQIINSKDAAVQQTSNRLSVVMQKAGDKWLVSKLEPI